MRIAVLSDIHSNKYALKACLDFITELNVDKFIFLGDFFGYYPWARECIDLLQPYINETNCILGNHDELMFRNENPNPKPEYYHVLEHNLNQLSQEEVNWFKELPPEKKMEFEGVKFMAYHGTPDDSLNGRYYPDNRNSYSWFPKNREVLLLGHTHYPITRKVNGNGLIINPGSVGQPRDFNLKSSFSIFDTDSFRVENIRIEYPIKKAIKELEEMNWYLRAIQSLRKVSKL